jgi:ATP-binding cassette subfamily B protein
LHRYRWRILLVLLTIAVDTAFTIAFYYGVKVLRHTVIAVTHRLTSVVHADHIFVLDGGRLVEHGRHEDLQARGGVYHDLWNKQAGFIISKGGREARVATQRLRQIPLFGTLDDAHLALLADQFTSAWAGAGQVIIEEGDIGDTFYLIVRGTADVVRMHEGAERLIDTLQDGDYFGEMALLSETGRMATVRARTPCLLLTLARDEFTDLVSSAPDVRRMIDDLVRERLLNIEASRR